MRTAFLTYCLTIFNLAISQAQELCLNGGFEKGLDSWVVMGVQVAQDTTVVHSGAASARCVCSNVGDKCGLTQHIVLDQKAPIPIVLTAWSKAQNVNGPKGNHYSLWCDIEYQNDLRPGRVDDWHIAPFGPQKEGWQRVETIFSPKYPIKHLNLHLLFRNQYTGTVWFDDASLRFLCDRSLSGSVAEVAPIERSNLHPDLLACAAPLKKEEALAFVTQAADPSNSAGSVALLVGQETKCAGRRAYVAFPLRAALTDQMPVPAPPCCTVCASGLWEEKKLIVEIAPGQERPLECYLLLPEETNIRMVTFDAWEAAKDTISLHSLERRLLLKTRCAERNSSARFSVFIQQAQPIVSTSERPRPDTFPLSTDDGLTLHLGTDGAMWAVFVDKHDLTSAKVRQAPFGLLLGDAEEGFFRHGHTTLRRQDRHVTVEATWPESSLQAQYTWRASKDYIALEGTVHDLRGTDRRVDLLLRLPIAPQGLEWWNDLCEKQSVKDLPYEAEGLTFGCVTCPSTKTGIGIGLSPALPCVYTLGFDPKEHLLHVRIKYGLSPQAKQTQRAAFSLSIFRVNAKWGLRDAAQRYYHIYPFAFQRRAMKEGMWLFAIETSRLPNPQDYGYREGGPSGADLDEKLGILTFPYIIPGQRSIQGLAKLPTDYEEAMRAVAEFQPPQKYPWGQDIKRIVENCRVLTPDGKFPITIRDDVGADIKPKTPINMVVFPVNCDPDLFQDKEEPTVAKYEFQKVKTWIANEPLIDGIYIDSGSGWVSRYLNVRTDHFPYADYPLTYDIKTGKLAIDGRFSMVEFMKWLGDLLHPTARLVFSNLGCDRRVMWHYFVSDVIGLEGRTTDIRSLRYFRTLAWQKPTLRLDYLGLQGTDTILSTRQGMEEYFKRCVLFGIYPSIGRRCDEAYQKFRDLYTTYMPILRRLGAAGWHPVTHATCDQEGILIERFGPKNGELFFTLYNESDAPKTVKVFLDTQSLGLRELGPLTELVCGAHLRANAALPISIGSGDLRVIALKVQ